MAFWILEQSSINVCNGLYEDEKFLYRPASQVNFCKADKLKHFLGFYGSLPS